MDVTILAEGYNSFETTKSPVGTVKYLPDPSSVIKLIQSGKLKEHSCWCKAGRQRFSRRR